MEQKYGQLVTMKKEELIWLKLDFGEVVVTLL